MGIYFHFINNVFEVKLVERCYLFVHSSRDGSADLHPEHKATLEVLLQE